MRRALLALALLTLSALASASTPGWTYARLYVLTEYPASARAGGPADAGGAALDDPTLTRTFEERRP